MAQHFYVEFGLVDPADFYSEDGEWEKLDEKFKNRVIEELGEDCSVEKVYSESTDPPYAVFRASFTRSGPELYEKFGESGMVEIVETVAEEVYGYEVTSSRVEGW